MALSNANRADWEDVYVQAHELRQLSPWNILPNEVLFRLKSPYHDQDAWCMFMGAAGEVFGLNIYLGEEGYASYDSLQRTGRSGLPPYHGHIAFFNQHMLQIEFVPPNELDKKDKVRHRAFGISASGDLQGIKPRYLYPGLGPIPVPSKLLPFLADCLEQTIILIEHIENDNIDPEAETFMHENYVYFTEITSAGETTWNYQIEPLPPVNWQFSLSKEGLKELLSQKLGDLPRREVDLFYHLMFVTGKVRDKGAADYFPLIGAFLEKRTGYAHPPEIYNRAKLEEQFVSRFCKQLQQLGYLPNNITVTSELTGQVLEPISVLLDIELNFNPEAEEVVEFASEMFYNAIGEF